jgi:ribosomal protein L37E
MPTDQEVADDRLTPAEKQACHRAAERESIRPDRRGTFAAGFIAAKRHFAKQPCQRCGGDTYRKDVCKRCGFTAERRPTGPT